MPRVHVVAPLEDEGGAPAFARSTAAHAIRETMRDPGIEAISDIATKEAKMKEALSQHQLAMAEDKVKDPSAWRGRGQGVCVVVLVRTRAGCVSTAALLRYRLRGGIG